ncbi:hypothetical protein I3843_16G094400 [Carya illinoinensis]|nr:hypothetical protein I3843_16G094400 [Carya illinoinensis]
MARAKVNDEEPDPEASGKTQRGEREREEEADCDTKRERERERGTHSCWRRTGIAEPRLGQQGWRAGRAHGQVTNGGQETKRKLGQKPKEEPMCNARTVERKVAVARIGRLGQRQWQVEGAEALANAGVEVVWWRRWAAQLGKGKKQAKQPTRRKETKRNGRRRLRRNRGRENITQNDVVLGVGFQGLGSPT